MEVTLNVRRFNPEEESPESRFQEYNLEVEDYFTVLDALIKVREEVDGSLAAPLLLPELQSAARAPCASTATPSWCARPRCVT